MERRWHLLVAASLLAAACAPNAEAATTIGSSLANDANSAICGTGGPYPGSEHTCMVALASGPPASVATGGIASPVDGVITSWRVKTGVAGGGTESASVRLRIMDGYTPVASGDKHDIALATPDIYAFATRMQIKTGQRIGVNAAIVMASSVSNLNVASNPIMHASPAAGVSDLWSGASADGQTIAPDDTTMNFEVLANAQIEPDVDGDGFGDETQDACPKDASKQAPCPVIDKTAPVVSDASFSNTAFFVDKAGQAARTSRSAPKGTVLRFKLSEPAAVTVTIERAAKGRKVKGKCAKATHRNRKRKRCALYKQSGSFKLAGQAGPNEKTFSGKVGGKSLRRGSYRATLVATDTAGNKSKAAELRFSIVRR